jgi:hypothetical protein
MINLTRTMTGRLRTLMFAGGALASVAFLVNLKDGVALLIGHFGVTWSTALFIVSLVLDGSWVIACFFPYIIPVEITVQVLVAIFGVAYAAGW